MIQPFFLKVDCDIEIPGSCYINSSKVAVYIKTVQLKPISWNFYIFILYRSCFQLQRTSQSLIFFDLLSHLFSYVMYHCVRFVSHHHLLPSSQGKKLSAVDLLLILFHAFMMSVATVHAIEVLLRFACRYIATIMFVC